MLKIPQWKISHRIETKQSTCNAHRLIGFDPIWVSITKDYWTAQNKNITFFTQHTSMILRVYILHKLDSCQGKMYKKHAEVTYITYRSNIYAYINIYYWNLWQSNTTVNIYCSTDAYIFVVSLSETLMHIQHIFHLEDSSNSSNTCFTCIYLDCQKHFF